MNIAPIVFILSLCMAGCGGFFGVNVRPSIPSSSPIEFRIGQSITTSAKDLVGGTYKFVPSPNESIDPVTGQRKLTVPLRSVSFWDAIDWALAASGVIGIGLMVASVFTVIFARRPVLGVSMATSGALTLGGVIALKMFLGWIVGLVCLLILGAALYEGWIHRKKIKDLLDDGKINNSIQEEKK